MKTTVEIADPLLEEARRLAAEQGVTLRALVERGLRNVVSQDTRRAPFKASPVTFKGEGLQPDVKEGAWSDIRDLIYEGRGG
jgi:hypothetical protein